MKPLSRWRVVFSTALFPPAILSEPIPQESNIIFLMRRKSCNITKSNDSLNERENKLQIPWGCVRTACDAETENCQIRMIWILPPFILAQKGEKAPFLPWKDCVRDKWNPHGQEPAWDGAAAVRCGEWAGLPTPGWEICWEVGGWSLEKTESGDDFSRCFLWKLFLRTGIQGRSDKVTFDSQKQILPPSHFLCL